MQILKVFLQTLIYAGLALGLAACGTLNTKPTYNPPEGFSTADTSDLELLSGLHQVKEVGPKRKKDDEDEVSPFRIDAIKETAMALGAQGALSARGKQVNAMLEKSHEHMDAVFNFEALILEDGVLPPVILKGTRTFNLDDNETIRIADETYTIVKQARFVTAPPTWRNYLWLSYEKPEAPDYTMLPKEDREAEVKAWQDGLNAGWEQGLHQADLIFAENLARLKRDYEGMVLYRKLLDQKMISAPFVAKSDLGVTGGGKKMTINDRVKRIAQQPSLNSTSKEWAPAVARPFTQVAQADLSHMHLPPNPEMELGHSEETHMDPSTYVK